MNENRNEGDIVYHKDEDGAAVMAGFNGIQCFPTQTSRQCVREVMRKYLHRAETSSVANHELRRHARSGLLAVHERAPVGEFPQAGRRPVRYRPPGFGEGGKYRLKATPWSQVEDEPVVNGLHIGTGPQAICRSQVAAEVDWYKRPRRARVCAA